MKQILVVDDSATLRRMVITSLRSLRASFLEAANGLEAIERLALGAVDLMILDMNMPDMHGLEVVEFVRGHAPFQSLPIIVLTTRGDEGSRSAALASGVAHYLTKPFDPSELATCARELLQLN